MNVKPDSNKYHTVYSRDSRAKLVAEGKCYRCKQPNDRLPKVFCSKCEAELKPGRKEHYWQTRSEQLRRRKEYNKNLRLRALQIISGLRIPKCVYCGCDDIRALEINHKNGGGVKEAKFYRASRRPGLHLAFLIVKGKRKTDDLEVTCRICNALHYINLRFPDLASRFTVIFKKSDSAPGLRAEIRVRQD